MGTEKSDVVVALSRRELTLIRIALLARLDDLDKKSESYAESKAILSGKLWEASLELRRSGK